MHLLKTTYTNSHFLFHIEEITWHKKRGEPITTILETSNFFLEKLI